MPSQSVDLIATDPPYNLKKNYGTSVDWREWSDYEDFTKQWLREALRVLKPQGSIYVFMGVQFIARLFLMLKEEGMVFNGWITWHYTQGMGRKKGFSPRHEDILYFCKGANFKFNLDNVRIPQKYFRKRNNMDGANPGDVWQFSHVHYSSPERTFHPTQKPLALMERIIKASSDEGDLVLDPFVGSGTTCLAAKALSRRWIGIDSNAEYVQLSLKRLGDSYSRDSLDPRETRKSRNSKQPDVTQIPLLKSGKNT